jgi:hypothetical protein
MRKLKHEIHDRFGNLVERADGVLQDGDSIRVPLLLRDAVAKDAVRRRHRTVQRDPRGHELSTWETEEIEEADSVKDNSAAPLVVDSYGQAAGYRPGPCYAKPAAAGTADAAVQVTARAMRDEARRDAVVDASSAWRGNAGDREVARVHDTKDELANAWLDQVADLTSAWSGGKRGVR